MSKVRGPRGFEKPSLLNGLVSISEVTRLPTKVVPLPSGHLPLGDSALFSSLADCRSQNLGYSSTWPSCPRSPVSPAFPSLCFLSHSVVLLPQSHWLPQTQVSTAEMSSIDRFRTPKLVKQPSA